MLISPHILVYSLMKYIALARFLSFMEGKKGQHQFVPPASKTWSHTRLKIPCFPWTLKSGQLKPKMCSVCFVPLTQDLLLVIFQHIRREFKIGIQNYIMPNNYNRILFIISLWEKRGNRLLNGKNTFVCQARSLNISFHKRQHFMSKVS